MSDLDDKLAQITSDCGCLGENVVPRIKQVFAQAGFYPTDVFGTKMMTGAEFYERFAELIKDHGFYERVTEEFVHEAARRAAGLEQ